MYTLSRLGPLPTVCGKVAYSTVLRLSGQAGKNVMDALDQWPRRACVQVAWRHQASAFILLIHTPCFIQAIGTSSPED